MKLGLLVSGNLGFTVLKLIDNLYDIIFVMTNKNSVQILDYCSNKKISYFVGNPRNNKSRSFIQNKDIDVLMSVNYLFLIDEALINHPKILAFNIHGSLLPKYRGRTPHVWAIINGEIETGITAHLIDKECDTGDIIYQEKILISNKETGADILNKFNIRYPKIIINILENINNDNINRIKQNNNSSSYFPKRTPDDGKINLNLNSKQIYNWVRAQSFPYPGAYIFYKSKKVIIDQVKIVDTFFDKNLVNGTITRTNPLMIKVKDGVLEISKIRNFQNIFKKNSILN